MADHGSYTDKTPDVTSDGGYTGRPPDYPPISYDDWIDGTKYSLLTGEYKEEWAPDTWYEPGDMVTISETDRDLLLCLRYHKSGNEWTDDTDKWGVLFDLGQFEIAIVPPGGTTGQVLQKASATNYDFEWGTKATGVEEAPNDGQSWVRKNLSWSALGSVGIGEAPIDGTEYVRKDGGWVSNSGGSGFLTDAPSDGNPYLRLNGAWAVGAAASHGHASSVITYDNTISGLTATTVKAALDELSNLHDILDGLDVAYDNSGSGLTAINVQTAIDELASDLTSHEGLFHITEAPIDGNQYARINGGWAIASGGGGATVTMSDSPPGSPASGALWYDTDNLNMMVWYNDGTSSQWVPLDYITASSKTVVASDTAPTSPFPGMLWIDTTTFGLKMWYDDGTSTQWVSVALDVTGGLGEAPSDGNEYVRKDGAWVIVSAGGIADAPSDGTIYGRKDAGWIAAAAEGHTHAGTYAEISSEDELAGDMKLAVVDVLPGTKDPNTLYFVI